MPRIFKTNKMNRFITTCLGLGLLANLTAFAGGFVTNTNQNVAFLRNPAQDAAIQTPPVSVSWTGACTFP